MKHRFEHPEPSEIEKAGPLYWRSLDELEQSPRFQEWLEREFPQGAAILDEGTDRRAFLKLMGASFALGGLGVTGCRRPEKYLMPYSKAPEGTEQVIPGVPNFYATSLPRAGGNVPLIVESHENRPTKIEGNPSYEATGGKTDAWAQASVLDLYDQDRAPFCLREGNRISRAAAEDFLARLNESFSANGGKGLAILAEPSSSLTRNELVSELKAAMPAAVWAEYDPLEPGNAERALEALTGQRLRARHHFARARRVLSVDADFLGNGPASIQEARGFARARSADTPEQAHRMNRLYAVESQYSLTGAGADHRLRLASAQMTAFLARLGAEILAQGGNSAIATFLRTEAGPLAVMGRHADSESFAEDWVRECAKDLLAHRGESLVLAGAHLPEEAHALVYLINEALGAITHTVDYVGLPRRPKTASIAELAAAMKEGSVETLVILGGNPAFTAPGDLEFESLLGKVNQVVRLGYHGPGEDESSAAAQVFLPARHYLESWDDGRTVEGAYVPVQPLIQPIFEDTFCANEVLARLLGTPETDAYSLVRASFARVNGADSQKAFERWLAEGLLKDTGYRPANPAPRDALPMLRRGSFKAPAPGPDALEVRFVPGGHGLDGSFANNGWMLERPDPISRLTWDSAILVSPRLARELGHEPALSQMNTMGQLRPQAQDFSQGKEAAPIAELTVNGRTVRAPIHILPGLADYTVVLPLGLGRRRVGRVGLEPNRREGGVGYDFYPLTAAGATGMASGATARLTGERATLANVQMHWSMEGRAIIREASNTFFAEHPDFVEKMGMEAHSPPIYGPAKDASVKEKATSQPRGGSLYEHPSFPGKNGAGAQQWGMTIDLNTCTGCNACVIACQSENNIPIVGKDQVLRGREMHWIRIDRYFAIHLEEKDGHKEANTTELPGDPQVSFMPVNCMHCENAPCEQVCPVNATVHDDQGLNVMAYNRCVGTRYCANNCPYKVRRFNFFDWNKRKVGEFYKGPLGEVTDQDLSQMQKNPEVTIRMRGVMEKCTFCVQRIQNARIHQLAKAKDSDNIEVPDGTFQVACQQACPVDAIEFGDITDTTSRVYQKKQSSRDYSLLGYLNLRPRTTYLAKLRNPNQAMPDAYEQPLSRQAYDAKSGHAGAHNGKSGHDAEEEPAHNGAEH